MGFASLNPSYVSLRLAADKAQIFPRHGGARERGDLSHVIGRRNLDYIHPYKGQLRQTAQDRLRLPGGETADFRRSSAGRKRRIEHVDVEAEIDGCITHSVADARRDRGRPYLMRLLRRDDGHAARHRPIMDIARHRRANSHLDHAMRLNEPFLDRVIEYRTMPKLLPETVGPCIDMSVKMKERRRAVPVRKRAQERQGNAVVAAERNQVLDFVRLS